MGRRLQTLSADARTSLRGLAAMLRWSLAPDELPLALALFHTASIAARRGERTVFELVLANVSLADRTARVAVDIYRRDDPSHPQGHYAYFEKRVWVPRRRAQRVTIAYDWQQPAEFIIDGVALAADLSWRGPGTDDGTYDVHALLLGPAAAPAQRLSLVQELA